MHQILAQTEKARWKATLALLSLFLPQRKSISQLDPEIIHRVLVIRDDGLGDAITTLPMLRLLRRLLPEAEIDVFCSHRNAQVFAALADVSRIWVSRNGIYDWVWAIRLLRRVQYNLIILTVRNQTSWHALFMNAITAPHTILAASFRGKRYRQYFDFHSHCAARGKNEWEQTFFLLCELFAYSPALEELEPFFPVVRSSWERAARQLEQLDYQCGNYTLLNLSAYQAHNRWGYDQLHQTLELLRQRLPLPLLACGTSADQKCYHSLLERHGIRAYPSTPDIHEIAGIVASSRCVVTPDTGIVHLATALRTPLVALYSSNGMTEYYWAPYRHKCAQVLRSELGKPLSTISPCSIVAAVTDLLAQIHADTVTP